MQRRYLTAKQVAGLFQLNVDSVYDLVGTGQMPATKLCGRWRFDESELREWFKTHRSPVSTAQSKSKATSPIVQVGRPR